MSYRLKLLAAFGLTVIVAVWAVSWAASAAISRTFEGRDAARTAALVAQVRLQMDREGREIVRRLEAVAGSAAVVRIAAAGKAAAAEYASEAQTLAGEQALDFLEIAAVDTAIISSAHWPARFGYKLDWLAGVTDWKSQPPFLREMETPEGAVPALVAVRTAPGPEGGLYLVAGERIDSAFLAELAAPEGMQLALFSNTAAAPAELGRLLEAVRRGRRDTTVTLEGSAMTGIPLTGRDGSLLAVLVVTNSRAELAALKASIRNTAILTGGLGVLLGLAVSVWAASRVSRPVRRLAGAVRRVAAGDWEARAEISSQDEIGQLAADFNQMSGQLVEQKSRMLQAERVAAWRELARRLAHELKNPLFPLQITVENLARARSGPPEQFDEVFRESTATLLAEIGNLKKIIGRFSDFAKMPAPEIERVNLNELARDVARLYAAQMTSPGRPRIESRLELQDELPPVAADPEQMRRMLNNLVLNAMDAMPDGGSLTIRTAARNGSVALEVSDTGQGLTREECERLFTPYYTTKQHGTGLGLAIVQSVVSDHKGSIHVESEPGKGTTFRIEMKADEPTAAG